MDQNVYYTLRSLINTLVPLSVCVILPMVALWLHLRHRRHESDLRTQIVMTAIEKNGEIDVQQFLQSLTPPEKPRRSLRERLVMLLHWEVLFGTLLTVFGVGLLLFIPIGLTFLDWSRNDTIPFILFGLPSLAIGLGLLVAYGVGKRNLQHLQD